MEKRVNILLVDDRADGLIALEAVLKSPEHNLVMASSGAEALGKMLEHDFAVILLDVQMPGMDGYECARVIKQRERSRHTPIIFVTAISKEQIYAARGYEMGAVDYITKPFDPLTMRAKVAVFVELYRKTRMLEEQSERLARSEERNRLLVDSARDIIATAGADGRIRSLNPAFERLTGWKREEWVGRHWIGLCHPDDVSRIETLNAQLLQQETGLFEFRFPRADGTFFIVEASARPFVDEHGRGLLAMLRDISERKQAEEIRRRAYELERANRELEQFAHICSHDLQEPLRLVVSFSQLLKRNYHGRLGIDADEIVEHVVSGARRMSQLVQDLLAYSRLGDRAAAMVPFSSNEALTDALSNLSMAIEDSHAKLHTGELPEVCGNRGQIARLFQNLVANALKFRGATPPSIAIGAERHGGEWIFSVRDNGIGFDMEYVDRIFVVFKRLHRLDEYPGTGIGLAICKRIVERHGGRIWARAESGRGATFFFTLPDAGSGDAACAAPRPAPEVSLSEPAALR